MLVIRRQQMDCFAQEGRTQFALAMCACLRSQFSAELWEITQDGLLRLVRAALARAATYALHSERDCRRYLNLCVIYGWEFDRQPELAWMGQMLTDAGISSPGLRLERLVQHAIYRREVEEDKLRLDLAHAEADGDPPFMLLVSKDDTIAASGERP